MAIPCSNGWAAPVQPRQRPRAGRLATQVSEPRDVERRVPTEAARRSESRPATPREVVGPRASGWRTLSLPRSLGEGAQVATWACHYQHAQPSQRWLATTARGRGGGVERRGGWRLPRNTGSRRRQETRAANDPDALALLFRSSPCSTTSPGCARSPCLARGRGAASNRRERAERQMTEAPGVRDD